LGMDQGEGKICVCCCCRGGCGVTCLSGVGRGLESDPERAGTCLRCAFVVKPRMLPLDLKMIQMTGAGSERKRGRSATRREAGAAPCCSALIRGGKDCLGAVSVPCWSRYACSSTNGEGFAGFSIDSFQVTAPWALLSPRHNQRATGDRECARRLWAMVSDGLSGMPPPRCNSSAGVTATATKGAIGSSCSARVQTILPKNTPDRAIFL
jgi:hypothetical protein